MTTTPASVTQDADLTAEVEPWRDAVRRASSAVGLVAVPSTRYIELSHHARAMVGWGSDIGLDVLSPEERTEAAVVSAAAAAGAIDGTEARRRQWWRADGSVIEVTVRARAVRLDGGTVGLFVARELSTSPTESLSMLVGEQDGLTSGENASGAHAVATLDQGWRVRTLADDTGELGDVLGNGVALGAVTHPDDIARLLFAFAGATARIDAATRIRLVSLDNVVTVDVSVARLSHGLWRLTMQPVRTSPSVAELVRDLKRIADELQEADVPTGSTVPLDVMLVPGVRELPERQREIVMRLARAERVGTIAAGMYLSPSTVRNHLTAVFRKFGVHSQAGLLAVLRGDASAD